MHKRGSLLLAIDNSSKHVLSVWDWNKGYLLAKTPVGNIYT